MIAARQQRARAPVVFLLAVVDVVAVLAAVVAVADFLA